MIAMRFWIAVALLSAVAQAEDIDRSKTHYQAAVAHFDAGDYEKALAEFQSAAKHSSRPEFQYNIARCYEMIGDALHAYIHFRRYLELRPQASDRSDVLERLERLQRRVGELQIRVTRPEAEVSVDGARVTVTLDKPIAVTVGAHVVVATRPGFAAASATVDVRGGEMVSVTLDPSVPLATAPPKRRVGLWVGVGVAAAVVVAGAITAGVLLSRPAAGGTDFWQTSSTACMAPCKVEDLR
jgi:hypothetical protein